jgi:ribosomal protein L37AE/L43A
MQKRICPNCNFPCYSAAETAIWLCPRCGAEILPREDPKEDTESGQDN